MKIIKEAESVDKEVHISAMPKSHRDYYEQGVYKVRCPKCKAVVTIGYEIEDKETKIREKFCPYCGKKLVKESKYEGKSI